MHRRTLLALVLLAAVLFVLPGLLRPGLAGGRAPVPELTDYLTLQWTRDLPPLRPAWPDQAKLQFDAVYPLAANAHTLFVALPPRDSLAAYDAATGRERWTFHADGPIRFAPALWQDRVYLVSDDGKLYCLDARTGDMVWNFRGGPSDRKVLGNDRLISTWPARGAPVIAEEQGGATVYFAAGIWPFMGVFLHALDAETGRVKWTNDGDGSMYVKQPHNADSFAGVAPQGQLVVQGDRLLVPGGRSVPAVYDRHTGKLFHFRLADNGKQGGGHAVQANDRFFVSGDAIFELTGGDHLDTVGTPSVLTDDALYAWDKGACRAYDVRTAIPKRYEEINKKGNKVWKTGWDVDAPAAVALPGVECMLKAGQRLYVGSPDKLLAITPPTKHGRSRLTWEARVEGRPGRLIAAGGRLFAVTRTGRLYCFADEPDEENEELTHHAAAEARPTPDDNGDTERADSILRSTGVSEGYAVVWGVGDGGLAAALARRSKLRLLVVDPDRERVETARSSLEAAGFDTDRIHVLCGTPRTVQLPPYFANIMVSDDWRGEPLTDASTLPIVFASLRPYGGVACLPTPDLSAPGSGLVNARTREVEGRVLLVREGALPGAANWTHEHGDAANTRVSRDRLVKAPLGLLWFGGTSHEGILPRHGHGPQPQVVDGRLFIEGMNLLRALDIYTGRLLWEAKLPGVGALYDNLAHQPGANGGGSNYVSTSDGVYVCHGPRCVRLDPATGREMASFKVPPFPKERRPPTWYHVNVVGDLLIAAVESAPDDPKAKGPLSSSRRLHVLDRHTGQLKWSATAKAGFRHNTICAGGGRLFVIDRPSEDHVTRIKRKDLMEKATPRLIVFDLQTGTEVWSTTKDVFGTWLSYSEQHDVLMESGRNARDTLSDEAKGMRAYKGATGKVLWENPKYLGPAMIHGDWVVRDGGGCDLLTGAPRTIDDPLTGERTEWRWGRNYGCNTPSASEHLLTFRSGAAGFYDLCGDAGTGNLGGFRSSCTNNLIVAGGVLSAPDYTRTCTCSYQNQTSLAFVPEASGEMWTHSVSRDVTGVVKRVGINLGAPGNRKSPDGTLWLEAPAVGGPTHKLGVTLTPPQPERFRRHESQVNGDGPPWVVGSGVVGLRSLTVDLAPEKVKERRYTVRLYFAEPESLDPGDRVFDVELQGDRVLSRFDVVDEAGGPLRGVVKEVRGVRIGRSLTISLNPAVASRHGAILSGVELLAE